MISLRYWPRLLVGELLVVTIPFAFALPTALFAAALPLRVRWPARALLCCIPALAGGLGWPATIIALYRIGRTERRWSFVIAWVALAPGRHAHPLHLKLAIPWQDRAMSVAFSMVSLIGPTACGALVSLHRDLTSALTSPNQARQAELEARLEGARSAERARIAREIHDSVGHHSTLIAVQSAALTATRESAQQLRTLAKQATLPMGRGDQRRPVSAGPR